MSIDLRRPEYAYLREALERIGQADFSGRAAPGPYLWGGGLDMPDALGRGLARTTIAVDRATPLPEFFQDVAGSPLPAGVPAPAPPADGGVMGRLARLLGLGAATGPGEPPAAVGSIGGAPTATGLSAYEQLLWDAAAEQYAGRVHRHARAIQAASDALSQPGGGRRAIEALAEA